MIATSVSRARNGKYQPGRSVKPFCLTMPDNHYWSVGKKVGQAWGIGKELIRK